MECLFIIEIFLSGTSVLLFSLRTWGLGFGPWGEQGWLRLLAPVLTGMGGGHGSTRPRGTLQTTHPGYGGLCLTTPLLSTTTFENLFRGTCT